LQSAGARTLAASIASMVRGIRRCGLYNFYVAESDFVWDTSVCGLSAYA